MSKIIHTILFLFFIGLSCVFSHPFLQYTYAQTPAIQQTTVPYVPGQILIQYKSGAAPEDTDQLIQPPSLASQVASLLQLGPNSQQQQQQRALAIKQKRDALEKKIGVKNKQHLFSPNTSSLKRNYILQLQPGTNIQSAIKTLTQESDIITSAQPNYILHGATTTPNDPYLSLQWGLAKIQAPAAWDITTGSTSVTVAVVDSGIDYNHPDLQGGTIIKGRDFAICDSYDSNGACINPKPCPELANGYCDDDITDNFGHGTHVAGIIAASTNNGIGVSGINWQVTLLAVKVIGSTDNGTTATVEQGIQYAADNGAKIINLSLEADLPCSQTPDLQQAINYAFSKGVLVVAAAGNGNTQNQPEDAANVSPASCANVITVGATDPLDHRASYSNYGSTVSIAAPGGDISTEGISAGILSTKSSQCNTTSTGMCGIPQLIYNTNYLYANGTSMATPYVAGAAALLLAKNSSLSVQQLHDCLINNADPITTDFPIGPRLNVFKALSACGGTNITSTPVPGETSISFPTILLHGIGSGGDSVNPSSIGTTNPLTPQRTLTVSVYNASNQLVTNQTGTITFSAQTGAFSGTMNLGQIATGNYVVKVTTPKYLTKQIPGIISLTSGQQTKAPSLSLIVGDINGDNSLSILDYNMLLICYSDFGSIPAVCSSAQQKSDDLNDDGSVDALDLNLFLREISVQSGQ